MKRSAIIRVFAFMLSLLTLASVLAACAGGESDVTDPVTDPVTEAPDATEDETTAEESGDIVIVKDGASDYVLVRPDTATDTEINALKALRDMIKEKYGFTPELDTDGKRKPGTEPEYQVLIGCTNDPASASSISYIESIEAGKLSFVIEAGEKRLAIVASNYSMYLAAIEYLAQNFATESGIVIPEGFRYTSEVLSVEPSHNISAEGELEVKMNQLYTISTVEDSSGKNCRIIQGACTDGKYLYTCLNDGASTGAVTVIVKTELITGKIVAKYENLMIDHANDLTYNPKTNEILAVHNSPNRTKISVFDAETMELKEVKSIRLEIYAMEYDEYEDCYWVGISHGYDFARFESNLKKHTIYKGYSNGFTKQGMDADDQYIYFVLYKTNCIAVYTKDGEYVRQIDLPVTAGEPENISHVGDTFYIVYNNPSWRGGIVYETIITEK